MGKRIYVYRRDKNGNTKSIEVDTKPHDRPSDWEKVMQEGTLSERVLRGFQDVEQKQGSSMFRNFPFTASHVKRVWSEP